MRLFLLGLIINISFLPSSFSQNISSHLGVNRVLILVTDTPTSTFFKKQLDELQQQGEMQERKLIVYQVLPTKYGTGLNYPTSWTNSSHLYEDFNADRAAFKVILIGLDGTVKLKRESLLPADELFAAIDQMPLRKEKIQKEKTD